ncbi:hypothetical protein ACWFR5_17370 [Streptomyces sp. NPDC055092]
MAITAAATRFGAGISTDVRHTAKTAQAQPTVIRHHSTRRAAYSTSLNVMSRSAALVKNAATVPTSATVPE